MTSQLPRKRQRPFLSPPPFPKRKIDRFEHCAQEAPALTDDALDALIDQLGTARVGGEWWGAQPEIDPEPWVLLRTSAKGGEAAGSLPRLIWTESEEYGAKVGPGEVTGVCDPWHMLRDATELHCDADDPVQLIAGLSAVPVRIIGMHDRARLIERSDLRTMLREALGPRLYRNPFSGKAMAWDELVELCGQWRDLIDSNRTIAAVYGFAGWKRATTEPLLWDGSAAARFNCSMSSLKAGDRVAIWKSRTSAKELAALERAGTVLVEVEDGFIRSAGLGANCVPPQSIVVDDIGVHFDARSPSTLERMLQSETFSPTLLARAETLRERIVSLGLSKYDRGQEALSRRSQALHVLVPGQVEDDRAVLSSVGEPLTNLELLQHVRRARPDAHIIYKPHPDVEAGHRKGAIPDAIALHHADEVVRAPSISSWIALVDEVHVNSSLAGFEALLRSRKVTTYGVPFYAGWGLTEDLGPVPGRRTARRTLNELVAATLIVYPRYVDPVTNLPCPPEALIERLSNGSPASLRSHSPLPILRRLQGGLRRILTTVAGRG